MSFGYAMTQALATAEQLQARSVLGAIGHGIFVFVVVIFLIGLVLGLAIGFFAGRAVGRR